MMRWLGTLTAALVAIAPRVVLGIDAPHDGSMTNDRCSNCHYLYTGTAAGGTDYTAGCQGCHDVATASKFKFPWPTDHQAVPGQGGTHHSWSGYADNPAAGAVAPTGSVMYKRLVDGRLQCATCHDTHSANPSLATDKMDVSFALTVPQNPTTPGGGGSGQLALMATGTTPRGYRVEVMSVTPTYTFRVSRDAKRGAYATWSAPITFTINGTVALDDPAWTVRITGAPVVGDKWDFFVSYPFLRERVSDDFMCKSCHWPMVMNHVRSSGQDPAYVPNGTRTFSHPVGVALGAIGPGVDLAAVRDANGVTQATSGADADGNGTNNLTLEGGLVRCTTCHAIHNVDSNSLTTDDR